MKRSFAYALGICLCAGSLFAAAPNQQVAVDKNGQLRQPTTEEQQALINLAAARVAAPKVVTTHANGMVSIALDETTDHHFVATLNEDGELVLACTDDHVAATAISVGAMSKSTDSIMRIRPARTRATEKE